MNDQENIVAEQHDENYLKLIAAQNERNRVVKICEIQDNLTLEERRRMRSAIALGISITCVFASTLLSDMDITSMQMNEILMQTWEQLSSFEALKEYFKSLTPAMYLSAAATILNGRNYIRHHHKVQELEGKLNFNTMNNPTDFYFKVEGDSRK